MQIVSFTIENYRGIQQPLTISLERSTLVPIIGVNECGKTTILEAILAFDRAADEMNEGRHLKNVATLFTYRSPAPQVTATVRIDSARLPAIVESVADAEGFDTTNALLQAYRAKKMVDRIFESENDNDAPADTHSTIEEDLGAWAERALAASQQMHEVKITRNLSDKTYTLEWALRPSEPSNQHSVATAIVNNLPYFRYFDDFRHAVPDNIELNKNKPAEWARMLDALFKKANRELSVFDLPSMEPRLRKRAIAEAEQVLRKTLTQQWQTFNLEDTRALSIRLNYHDAELAINRPARLSLDVVETDSSGAEQFFDIKDRSKGFYWFFNFVMRLELNPEARSEPENSSQLGTIYLLDEPGSYLHASAQERLCKKLKQISAQNPVIFTTHSHHLLDPRIVPVTSIVISEKSDSGSISATSLMRSQAGEGDAHRLAFQPIYEALQLSPTALGLTSGRIVVVEGIYDFFALELFKPTNFLVVPAVGADSVRFVLSFLLASSADFKLLWDNDEQGISARERATRDFGEEVAERHFRNLPSIKGKKRILQDLFAGDDLRNWRNALGVPDNSNFKKVVLAVFYSDKRNELMMHASRQTREAFADLFESLWS